MSPLQHLLTTNYLHVFLHIHHIKKLDDLWSIRNQQLSFKRAFKTLKDPQICLQNAISQKICVLYHFIISFWCVWGKFNCTLKHRHSIHQILLKILPNCQSNITKTGKIGGFMDLCNWLRERSSRSWVVIPSYHGNTFSSKALNMSPTYNHITYLILFNIL